MSARGTRNDHVAAPPRDPEARIVAAVNGYLTAYRAYRAASADLDTTLIGARTTVSAHAADHPGPWRVETVSFYVRVIDADGADVVVVGDVRTPGVTDLANRIAQARS